MGVQTSTHTLTHDIPPTPLKGKGFAGVWVNPWVTCRYLSKYVNILMTSSFIITNRGLREWVEHGHSSEPRIKSNG